MYRRKALKIKTKDSYLTITIVRRAVLASSPKKEKT
jgi:hypothetical protein